MCDNRQNSDAANTVNSEDNKCIAEKLGIALTINFQTLDQIF